jgi:N-acetylglutamate synthase-like GNAT family acetyltransferase
MLDNPAWWALNSLHKDFARGTDQAKRYLKGILPFIACATDEEGIPADALDELAPWIEPGEVFYIIGRLPVLPKGWTMEFELPCAQMVLPAAPKASTTINTKAPSPAAETPSIETLGPSNATEMFDLINNIQPGYYNINTRQLGNYYGICHQKKLIAMAGERIQFPGFSELSAICTDPSYTGRGYAQHLITHICHKQAASNITPFLHVALSNQRAINLYERMGFQHRREISFWRCRKD